MCDYHLGGEDDGLLCNSKDPNPRHTHTFESSSGSAVNDRHSEGGHG